MRLRWAQSEGRDRGQTATLGVALVFAVIIAGSTVALALGAGAISETESELGTEQSRKSLTEFDSQAALVALGESGVQTVSLDAGRGADYRVNGTAGWMNVSFEDPATGTETVVFEQRMGALVYESANGRTLAYQGGGVWEARGDRSLMVSPPEFHYRGATLTLPLITVRGDRSIEGGATVTRANSTRYFPNASMNSKFVNPLDSGQVTVSVQSRFYRAWGQYFETRTDGNVTYDHTENRVNATLVTPVGDRRVRSPVQSSSPAGVITFKGSTDPGVDAYTSGDGDGYAGEGAANGWNNASIDTAGDVTVQDNGVELHGNITSGGYVDLKDWSNNFFGERVEYTDGYEPSPAPASVETEQISGIDGVAPIDGYVNRRVDDIQSDNDGSFTSLDSTTTLGGPSGDQEYYAENIDLDSGETLTVDTSDGNVTIAVRDYIRLDEAEIEVDGTHEARFFVKGETAWGGRTIKGETTQTHVDLTGASVETTGSGPSENSTQVAFYGTSDVNVTLSKDGSQSKLVGIVYAPSYGGNKYVMRKSEVFGGVVTGEVDIWQDGSIHYDKQLKDTRAVPKGVDVIRITYLHISVNRINVTSA